MKYMLTMLASIALACTAGAAIEGTGGITTQHIVTCTTAGGKTSCTRTTLPIIYNNTAYDRLAFTGPDGIKRWSPITSGWLHKSLRNLPTDPKIGETTPNYGQGGGGGGGGKHQNGPTGENGFTMYQTRSDGAVTATFIKDAFTCGSVFYSATTTYNTDWKFDSANYVPCPSPSPVPSSGSVSGPSIWDLIFENKGTGVGEEITNWTLQMEVDYFNTYGVWAIH